jgi:hypothetical protein
MYTLLLLLLCQNPVVMQGPGDGYTYSPNAVNYVLPTFTGASQVMNINCSVDGVNWNVPPLGTTIFGRDFSIKNISGIWWAVFTTGSYTSFGATSSSGPLCNAASPSSAWSSPLSISTEGAISGQKNSWAPEWFTDPNDSSLHVLVAITPDQTTSNTNQQIYELHPVGSNLAGTWSQPVHVTVTGESSIIDPFSVFVAGTYYIWYKEQQTNGAGCIGYASSTSLTGVYTIVKTGDWAGWLAAKGETCTSGNLEGVNLIHLADRWRLYTDYFAGSGSLTAGQINYSDSFDNWATWTPLIPIATAPVQAKHGTVVAYQ